MTTTYALIVYLLVGGQIQHETLKVNMSLEECYAISTRVQSVSIDTTETITHGQLVCQAEENV